jgi:hypothetical protein
MTSAMGASIRASARTRAPGAAARAEIWFGFKEPTWRLAELSHPAEAIVAEIPPHQIDAVRRNAAAAGDLLTCILRTLEGHDAAA